MAVFKLLAGTNCRQCGQPTCWSFALKLTAGQVRPADCPPLQAAEFSGRLTELEALLAPGMPAIG